MLAFRFSLLLLPSTFLGLVKTTTPVIAPILPKINKITEQLRPPVREAEVPNFTQDQTVILQRLQAEHPSANVHPRAQHWSVPFLSMSELRNTLGVHPLEIKRRRLIWILVLRPRPDPFDVLVLTRAEVRIQGIADAGART